MESPIGPEVDTSGLLPRKRRGSARLASRRLLLQARSLAAVLNVTKRRLSQLRAERTHTSEDLAHYQHMLDEIDGRWRDDEGNFAGTLTAADPKAAALCSRLFNECFDLLEGMRNTVVEMPPEVQQAHRKLVELRRRLQAMKLAEDHTLGEVLPLQRDLDGIDADRLEAGGFGPPAPGDQPRPGQAVCLEVLNQCYELLADCLRSAQDIDPEMQAVYDQLRGTKNALRKLAGRKHHTLEDLRHYQALLERVDSSRKDGLFCADLKEGRIPHGQAAALELLQQCYDLIEQLGQSAQDMPEDVLRVLTRLEQYRHQLEAMTHRPYTADELHRVQDGLEEVEEERQAHSGVFGGMGQGGAVPPGQAVCAAVLNHCHRLTADLEANLEEGEGAESKEE